MEKARWERLQEIYHEALALPATERDEFVESACAGDLDLLREVKALLKANDLRSGMLDAPVVALGSPRDSLIGSEIGGRYLVESELPHGGMSQVYAARDLKLQPQRVVIKILYPTLLENPYAQQKLDQEVEALLRMEHAGVVRVVDKGELPDGRPYIVMPYIDGVSLRTQIASQGMDFERAASIVRQIGAALDHVHEKKILHRDLKPENIMLRRGTDSVVLIDFGIAKVRASLIAPSTVGDTLAGTLPYMSPEQLRGEKLTPASDIYSMGIVAYEMLTGRTPFDPASPAQLLEMQRAGIRVKPRQLRENLSVEADRAIRRAVKFEPRARYQKAGEFGDELGRALLTPVKEGIPNWAKFIAGLVILAAVSYGLYEYIKRRTIVEHSQPSHSLTYWLTVQRMREGKEYQEPYNSNGEDDVFNPGDKFQLNISASEPGYLYVFDEAPPAANGSGFRMVYPNKANGGAANIGANQTVACDWITFHGTAGDENVWIVWSIVPVRELEDARSEALAHPDGELAGDGLVSVKSFLQMKKRESNIKVRHYKAGPKAVAKDNSDLLITLAQFKHR